MNEPRGTINQVPARLRGFAKEQRAIPTRAEALFWEQVRGGRLRGLKFKRQVPMAPYIVDLLCVQAKVVVELDGPPHDSPEREAADAQRDRWLQGEGFTVLRFSNDDVLGNCALELDAVLRAVEARPLSRPAAQGTLSR